jgi:hypothetical protein
MSEEIPASTEHERNMNQLNMRKRKLWFILRLQRSWDKVEITQSGLIHPREGLISVPHGDQFVQNQGPVHVCDDNLSYPDLQKG